MQSEEENQEKNGKENQKTKSSEALQASRRSGLVSSISPVGRDGQAAGVSHWLSPAQSRPLPASNLDGQRLVHLQSHVLNAAKNLLLVSGQRHAYPQQVPGDDTDGIYHP